MTVSETAAPGLTGRRWTIAFSGNGAVDFEAWTDDEGYDYLCGVNGLLGEQSQIPAGWIWDRMKSIGKTVTDVIAWCNPGPTLMPPPPMP